MNLNTFFKLNEKIVRILEEGYSDLTDEQRYKVSMNIQNTFIRDYINKHEETGTREEQNDLIMQWIDKYAEQFRNDLIAGKYDKSIEKWIQPVMYNPNKEQYHSLNESRPAMVPSTEQLSQGAKQRKPL